MKQASQNTEMKNKLVALLLVALTILNECECRCGDRLERALDMMQQRGNSARRRYDTEDPDAVYHQRLHSAPIDVSVTRLLVEIPNQSSTGSRAGESWAKVERCLYEPLNNSIRTRVAFNELAVSGLVQLNALPESSPNARSSTSPLLLPAESCRMSLRLRRAGMEFHTSPIARGRGQMRIRTESSFLEPRFASIYAYGCRPVIKSSYHYNRGEPDRSEPRKRELGFGFAGLLGETNTVGNSSSYDDDEDVDNMTEEENRLAGTIASIGGGTSADAMLDSLWRSRADIAREMEDVFLRSASQAITHYIERQLHPAIKETLMLSMGYTISYG